MGLKNGIKLLHKLDCKNFDLKKIVVDVYVDFHFLLFCENILRVLNTDDCNYKVIAETALTSVRNRILFAANKFNFKIRFMHYYFDGPRFKNKEKRPIPNKTKFIIKRTSDTNIISFIEIANYIKTLIETGVEHVNILDFGESENAIFHQRPKNFPVLLFTPDSDLAHIAYGYKKESENDLVFWYRGNDNFIYSMFNNITINPKIFKILCFLGGTDYNKPVLTQTMIDAAYKNIIYDVAINFEEDVEKIIHFILHNLIENATIYKFRLQIKKNKIFDETDKDCQDYIDSIKWLYKYSNNNINYECPILNQPTIYCLTLKNYLCKKYDRL